MTSIECIKFVKSQKTGEYVLIKEGDMDFNTRFALTLKDMKEEKRAIDKALTMLTTKGGEDGNRVL